MSRTTSLRALSSGFRRFFCGMFHVCEGSTPNCGVFPARDPPWYGERVAEPETDRAYLVGGFCNPPPFTLPAVFDETDLRGRSFTFELFLAAMVHLRSEWW